MHVPSKTYSSDYNSTSNYMRTPPRTDLEPWLIVRKSIISPILSPTLLQIYCIGLIGPISISYFFWVWATICDLTITILLIYHKYFPMLKQFIEALYLKFCLLLHSFFFLLLLFLHFSVQKRSNFCLESIKPKIS